MQGMFSRKSKLVSVPETEHHSDAELPEQIECRIGFTLWWSTHVVRREMEPFNRVRESLWFVINVWLSVTVISLSHPISIWTDAYHNHTNNKPTHTHTRHTENAI